MVWLSASSRAMQSILLLLAFLTPLISAVTSDSDTLDDNRQPALYTENFGDCNGASIIDVSRFDVALYLDNQTVTFHLQGNSLVTGMKTMMFLSVFAYGQQFFIKIFDPCFASVPGLCPSNISNPIEVNGFIPLAPSDTQDIPSIAYAIPDFEGQAMLRIFDNATESEIACYSAMITNGNTMSWPAAVGGTMGFVIFCALLASFLSAVYGNDIPTTRTHYAHSLSIFVVFATLHHVYFTGALSMNWASVLPAFWSNFAWSAGMINVPAMQNSINTFHGNNLGNTSFVGAAGVGHADNTAGGYDISAIYRRSLDTLSTLSEVLAGRTIDDTIEKRSLANATTGFYWYGFPVGAGLPIPGNFTGFPGTLSFEAIPASNAFLTGFLWLLILIACLIGSLAFLKGSIELMVRIRWLNEKRLQLFRRYWIGFTAMVVARTCFIAFFAIMFLSFFQFAYGGSGGAKAVTAIIFIIFLVCIGGITALSVYYRLRNARRVPDRLHLEVRTAWKVIPYVAFKAQSSRSSERKLTASLFSIPWFAFEHAEGEEEHEGVHQDEAYIRRYGWLVSRYRKSKWWFPSVWLVYEFIRALFFGAAAGHPSTQVFGLLVVEFIGLIAMIKMKPFESTRMNVLMIYLLGLSKVITVALSSAFHPVFGLPRIIAAGIAFIIIVIQGLLLMVMSILIFIGLFSTFFSLSRNRESLPNPNWMELRTKFFKHIAVKAADEKAAPAAPQPLETPPPTSSGFNVSSVRRLTKFDEGETDAADFDPYGSRISVFNPDTQPSSRRSRAASVYSNMSYSNLPYGARPHRASWSRDVSPVDLAPRRLSHSGHTLHTVGSDPALRNSYGVVPANRSSSYGSSVAGHRRSRSGTYKAVYAVAEDDGEEPPLPPNAAETISATAKGKSRVVEDTDIVASPTDKSLPETPRIASSPPDLKEIEVPTTQPAAQNWPLSRTDA